MGVCLKGGLDEGVGCRQEGRQCAPCCYLLIHLGGFCFFVFFFFTEAQNEAAALRAEPTVTAGWRSSWCREGRVGGGQRPLCG